MYYSERWKQRIRQEAASQAIEKTIQAVEEGLNTTFPRGGTPSDSRDMMKTILSTMNTMF